MQDIGKKLDIIEEITRIVNPDFKIDSYAGQKYFWGLDKDRQNIFLYVLFLRAEFNGFYEKLLSIKTFNLETIEALLDRFEFGIKCWNGSAMAQERIYKNVGHEYTAAILPDHLREYEDEIGQDLYIALNKIMGCKELSKKARELKFDNFVNDYLEKFEASLDSRSKSELH